MRVSLSLSILVHFLGIQQGHSQVCGKPVHNSRIVGGINAQDGSWPWQVALVRNDYFICGGALISSNWIITAAHCCNISYSADSYKVLLGWYQLRNKSSHAIVVNVKQVIVHENYFPQTLINDIALMELSQDVTFNNYILPVCLPNSSVQYPDGVMCFVTGWGNIKTGVQLPDPMILQEVEVPIVTRSVCDCLYHINTTMSQKYLTIPTTSICAGYTLGQKDSCQGDSGGPLACKQGDTWVLAGIVSFGVDCALPNRPGVYTRIATFQTWLQNKVAGLQFMTFSPASTSSVISSICQYQNGKAVKLQDNGISVNMPTTSSTSYIVSTADLSAVSNAVSKTINALTISTIAKSTSGTDNPKNNIQSGNNSRAAITNTFSVLNTIACTMAGFLLMHYKR